MRTTLIVSVAILVGGAALFGCSRTVSGDGAPDVAVTGEKQPGTPGRVVLVYDPELQVYAVEGHEHCYYSAGQYFRPGAKGWEWSVDVVGPWRRVKADSDVPPGLRRVDVSIHQKKAEHR
jgi:hypothetical protein